MATKSKATESTEVVVQDTEYKAVVVTHANPEVETPFCFVGGNDIIENGKHVLKHYRVQMGKQVELPETFIKQLKNRRIVLSVGSSTTKEKSVKLYNIEEV